MSGWGVGSMWVVGVVAAGGVLYGAACAYLYVAQRGMMYMPTAEVGVEGAEALRLVSGGERLKIWRVGEGDGEEDGGGGDAVVYFGGNAEEVSGNVPTLARVFAGRAVYLANYRGYSGSSGVPTEAGLFADALVLYDYVRARHRSVSVIGRSLGSAVAGYVAAEREPAKVVLVTPFDSGLNVARQMYPMFPISVLLKDRLETIRRVKDIAAPTLVFIAGQDAVITRNRTDALLAAFPAGQVRVVVIDHADHNNIDQAPEYAEGLVGFFDE